MALNPGMRMMMAQKALEPRQRSEYGGSDGRRMIGYDRDGEHDERRMGDYYGGYEMPSNRRRRDSRGRYMMGEVDEYDERPSNRRRRDSRGRYMMNDDDDDDEERGYSAQMRGGNSYGDIYAEGTIYAPGAMNNRSMGSNAKLKPVDERQAEEWVKHMQGADGSKGGHYEIAETEQHRHQICPECNRWEFYVAMNMMYADYCEAAQKVNADKPEFYARLAKAFLCDEDAGDHKLQKYMMTIPAKH